MFLPRCRSLSLLRKQSAIWISLLFGVLALSFLITTIVLAVLYGVERNKTKVEQEIQGKLKRERRIELTL